MNPAIALPVQQAHVDGSRVLQVRQLHPQAVEEALAAKPPQPIANPSQRIAFSKFRIVAFDGFLSAHECAHLMATCATRAQPSSVQEFGVRSALRTSCTVRLRRAEDEVVTAIERRAADVFEVAPSRIEPLQVVRYTPGQQFAAHHDYFPTGSRELTHGGGQRCATLLVYLNTLDAKDVGGCTSFPMLQVRVRPIEGMAIAWLNTHTDGQPLLESLHAGEPPKCSTKFCLNIWVRRGHAVQGVVTDPF